MISPLHYDTWPVSRAEASRILSGHVDHRTRVKSVARQIRDEMGLPPREVLR